MSISEKSYQNDQVLHLLQEIFSTEMEGLNRYLHYSFMVMGYNRIPIQKWFRDNALEAKNHAIEIGEKIVSLGGHPTMQPPKVEEHNLHTIQQLLEESLKFEQAGLDLYKKLVLLAVDVGDIALEELARQFVKDETEHMDEVRKMLRKPDTP